MVPSAAAILHHAQTRFAPITSEVVQAHHFVGVALNAANLPERAHRHFRRAIHLGERLVNNRTRDREEEVQRVIRIQAEYVPTLLNLGLHARALEEIRILARRIHSESPSPLTDLVGCLAEWAERPISTPLAATVERALLIALKTEPTTAPFAVERVEASIAKHRAALGQTALGRHHALSVSRALLSKPPPTDRDLTALKNYCLAQAALFNALHDLDTGFEGHSRQRQLPAPAEIERWLRGQVLPPATGTVANDPEILIPAALALADSLTSRELGELQAHVKRVLVQRGAPKCVIAGIDYELTLASARIAMRAEDYTGVAQILHACKRECREGFLQDPLALHIESIKLAFARSEGDPSSPHFLAGLRHLLRVLQSSPIPDLPPIVAELVDMYHGSLDPILNGDETVTLKSWSARMQRHQQEARRTAQQLQDTLESVLSEFIPTAG